jgi:hypothetical protein
MASIRLSDDTAVTSFTSSARELERQLADDKKRAEQRAKKQAWRKAYDAARTDKKPDIYHRKRKGSFVGIDSEGLNIGEPFEEGDHTYQDQRTFLWKAGGVAGVSDQELVNINGLSSKEIFDFLLSLPKKFNKAIGGIYAPIFVGFGFVYDVAQTVKDFPYDKGWEVKHGKPFEEKDNPDWEENLSRAVLWGDYAISCIPRKSVTLFRLKDPSNPIREDAKGQKTVDWSERIQIYDVYGFFQQRLTGAIADMPDVISLEELELIKTWKDKRGAFTADDIEDVSKYTSLELKALVNMMEKLRQSLHDAIPHKPIELRNWFGAGSIAKSLLDMHLGKDVKEILGNPEADTIQREWAFRAYFGGRIELAMQGRTNKPIYELDVASAYPAQAIKLPSMKGGRWEHVINPTREQVENASILSMFRVKLWGCRTDLPFYPLPYRTEGGSVV